MHKEVKLTPLLESIQFIEMSDEKYFSVKYADYTSNSKLSLINPEQGGSPEMYLEGLGKHGKYSDSLTLGSAVHELTLQQEKFFLVTNVDRPTAKLGSMADELYKYYCKAPYCISHAQVIEASDKIDYYKGKMNAEKIQNVLDKCMDYWKGRFEINEYGDKAPIFLDAKSREKLQLCMASITSNKKIQKLLHPMGLMETPISMNEAALFMDVKAEYDGKEVILRLKAKLDNFTYDAESGEVVLNDLKTTGHWLTDFPESFEKYHYARQMAMYSWMLKLYVEQAYHAVPTSLTANMLLVSTVPDYRCGVYKVTSKQVQEGFLEMRDLLQRVAYCQM